MVEKLSRNGIELTVPPLPPQKKRKEKKKKKKKGT